MAKRIQSVLRFELRFFFQSQVLAGFQFRFDFGFGFDSFNLKEFQNMQQLLLILDDSDEKPKLLEIPKLSPQMENFN